jgi:Ca-activated chloride channel family protein
MEATDVSPTRIDAAKAAATSFLKTIPDACGAGVVGFDGSSQIPLDPTTDTEAVKRTIERLQLGEGTAIGEAVFWRSRRSTRPIREHWRRNHDDDTADDQRQADRRQARAGAVVLLSDGETTQGRPNDEAAQAARPAGVAVNTIAFGTDSGIVTGPDGSQIPVPVNRDAEDARGSDRWHVLVRADRGSAQAGLRSSASLPCRTRRCTTRSPTGSRPRDGARCWPASARWSGSPPP